MLSITYFHIAHCIFVEQTVMGNHQPKLSKEDLDMLLSKTCFTKTQIKQWYKGFMVSRRSH